MSVTHNITIDMVRKGVTPRVYAMQFDANTRVVKISLRENGTEWVVPASGTIGLSYHKPDGTSGYYKNGEDGKNVFSVEGSTVAVTLAAQILSAAGQVDAAVVFDDGAGRRIAAFPFEIHVEADPSAKGSGGGGTGGGSPGGDDTGGGGSTDGGNTGGGSISALTSWEIVQSSEAVTLNYTLEDGSEHTDVITLDANGYPVAISHDGVAAPGAWREADV